MKRSQTAVLVPLLCWGMCVAPIATGAESVLSVVPDEALGLVVINRLSETDTKLQELTQAIPLPVPGMLAMLKMRLGTDQGLDASGSVALAVLADPAGGPIPLPVLFVPVTDYEKFMEATGTDGAEDGITPMQLAGAETLVGEKGGYAVITKKGHRQLLRTLLESPSRTPQAMAPWEKWLAESDAAMVVTRPGVQALCQAAQFGLQQVTQRLDEMPKEIAPDMEAAVAMLGLYQKVPEFAAKEVEAYAAGITIDPQKALHLTERVRLTPEGTLRDVIRDAKAPQGGLLAGLPARPLVGVFSGVITEALTQAMLEVSVGVMKAAPSIYGLNEQQLAKMAEISAQSMQGMRGMSMMWCEGQPDDPLFGNIVARITVDDANAYLVQYKELLAAMNELTKDVEKSVLTHMEFQDIELGGRMGLKVTSQIPVNPAMGNVPDYKKVMETMFGSGQHVTFYLAVADSHTIVLSYVSPELLLESLDVVNGSEPGIASDPSLAQTAALLSTDASWGGYLSPRGVISFVQQAVQMSRDDGEPPVQIADFPATPAVGICRDRRA